MRRRATARTAPLSMATATRPRCTTPWYSGRSPSPVPTDTSSSPTATAAGNARSRRVRRISARRSSVREPSTVPASSSTTPYVSSASVTSEPPDAHVDADERRVAIERIAPPAARAGAELERLARPERHARGVRGEHLARDRCAERIPNSVGAPGNPPATPPMGTVSRMPNIAPVRCSSPATR